MAFRPISLGDTHDGNEYRNEGMGRGRITFSGGNIAMDSRKEFISGSIFARLIRLLAIQFIRGQTIWSTSRNDMVVMVERCY